MILQTKKGTVIDISDVVKASVKGIIKVQMIPTWIIVILFLFIFIFAIFLFLVKKEVYQVKITLKNGRSEFVEISKEDFSNLNMIIRCNQQDIN